MNNKIIEELNYKIDNQEKIIRELQEKITLLNKMNEDNYNKYCNELKKNSKAIEYIEKYLYYVIDEYPDPEWKFVNEDGMPKEEAKKELLEILKGDSNE